MGRKVVVSGLRTSNQDEEMYATVSKILGNGMCEVKCMDEETRLCIIRKKFRGRGKQANRVEVGVTVMIGLRPWEKNERASLPKCDLLEVYSASEIRKLKQRGGVNLDAIKHDGIVTEAGEFEFETGSTVTNTGPLEDIPQQPNRYDLNSSSEENESDDDVDIDDI
jgi:translation initiation factor 1A